VVDFSGHYGSQNFLVAFPTTGPVPLFCLPGHSCPGNPVPLNLDVTEPTFLFGPRVSVSKGKFSPFAHAVFGASFMAENGSGVSNSDMSFAFAVGGGIDYRLMRLVGWRVQTDMLHTRFFSNTQNNVRISTELVVHF
jgi:hypothetical protein